MEDRHSVIPNLNLLLGLTVSFAARMVSLLCVIDLCFSISIMILLILVKEVFAKYT